MMPCRIKSVLNSVRHFTGIFVNSLMLELHGLKNVPVLGESPKEQAPVSSGWVCVMPLANFI